MSPREQALKAKENETTSFHNAPTFFHQKEVEKETEVTSSKAPKSLK